MAGNNHFQSIPRDMTLLQLNRYDGQFGDKTQTYLALRGNIFDVSGYNVLF